MSSPLKIFGQIVDEETRCVHYHTSKDVVAIKFYCCRTYYPCYKCHDETCEHPIRRWPKTKFEETAILCGHCQSQFSINTYLSAPFTCPHCKHAWNEGCALHYHIYFEA
ncbi:CHY zinc finger protein [Pontibacillus chungwhensis]|uniref:CHY zinc finger protein n=1 Tax=Pontibacillus chungwhensis TaxID=265426 RepID=UPI0009FCDA12|nr:CHY zinc finger protein [Pontibacillus chungwhensis]